MLSGTFYTEPQTALDQRKHTGHVGYYKMDILMNMGFGAQEETVGSGWAKWEMLRIVPLKGAGRGGRHIH